MKSSKYKFSLKKFLLVLNISLVTITCSDPYMGIEQIKTDSEKPEKVTVNEVVPKSGALEIHFSLPKGNPKIIEVVASYINNQGKKMEFNVSKYATSILVEGFVKTEEVTVELVCVDNSGNRSDVTFVKDTPLMSPVEQALKNLNVIPAFGGIKVEWQNREGNSLAIHVLTEDSLDIYGSTLIEDPSKVIYSSDSIYTSAYVRPYAPEEQLFGFTVSDKWGNRSDTLFLNLIPITEVKIDYTKIEQINVFNYSEFGNSRDYDEYGVDPVTGLQNDGNCHGSGNRPKTIFDGVNSGNQFYCYKFIKNMATGDASLFDMVQTAYATFNFNMEVQLSRIKIFPRVHISYTYGRSSPKHFRIWGTNDENMERFTKFPETWTLVGEYISRTPGDQNNLTAEEIEYFNEKNEFSIAEDNVNPDAQPGSYFRYMRLELLESYDPSINYYTINEMELYGDVKEVF